MPFDDQSLIALHVEADMEAGLVLKGFKEIVGFQEMFDAFLKLCTHVVLLYRLLFVRSADAVFIIRLQPSVIMRTSHGLELVDQ